MIDLHTHILPETDDGASSLEETLIMLALAAEDGVTEIVATPHCDFRFEFEPERCGEQLKRVQRASPVPLRLYLGCELHLTIENVERVIATPRRYTLNGGDYLLVELPDRFTAAAAESGLTACHRAGLRTVIAHPERNPHMQRNPTIARRLVELGCYLQLTAQSLLGHFGSAAERSAGRMLRQRIVHFVASDCHGASQRKPLLRKAYNAVARKLGDANAELLFVMNPRSALHSLPIQLMQPALHTSLLSSLSNSADMFLKSRFWSRMERIAGVVGGRRDCGMASSSIDEIRMRTI